MLCNTEVNFYFLLVKFITEIRIIQVSCLGIPYVLTFKLLPSKFYYDYNITEIAFIEVTVDILTCLPVKLTFEYIFI